ncbi:MAG TPA: hypothetical protein VF771_03135, partial [Longimicrobiaceae bacterium]
MLSPALRLLPGTLLVALAACTPPVASGPAPASAPLDSLYLRAIESAAVYRSEDVLPLKAAAPDSNGNVRVVTFTSYPYAAGPTTLPLDVWVTLVPEVRDSCRTFAADELPLRLLQLLGLPSDATNTSMVEMLVPAASLVRPAADPAITTRYPCGDSIQAGCGQRFPAGVDSAHVRRIAELFLTRWRQPGGYPWTRLGYTYNWHPG